MKINKNFVLREIAGEAMLVPVKEQSMETNGLISLTPVGALIYKALLEGKAYEDILHMILEKYDVQKEEAEKDIASFLSKLQSVKVLL